MAGHWLAPGTLTVGTERLVDGEGHSIDDERDLFVIHAVMMHTDKVLMFCGHVEDSHYALVSYLFDWRAGSLEVDGGGTAKRYPFPRMSPRRVRAGGSTHGPADFRHADLFCAHMVQLQDGRVLVLGGSDPDYVSHSSVGDKYISYFKPTGSSPGWRMALETRSRRRGGRRDSVMAEGRWYPTAVVLPDGRVAVVSGRTQTATIARTVEIITSNSPTSRRFRAETQTGADFELPIYPGLHLAPNGRIYYTHTTWGWEVNPPANTLSIEIPASPSTSVSWSTHPPPSQREREEGMSVLLPPAQAGKILVIGGALALDAADDPSVNHTDETTDAFTHLGPRPGSATAPDPRRAEILDTTTNTWSNAGTGASAGRTLHPRINGHCVILPDKKVLILGGHNAYKWYDSPTTTPSLVCEIYDPTTNTFTADASLTHPRTYHSAAVLLPNGTVLVAGGIDPSRDEPAPDNRPWSVAAPSGDADDWYDTRNWAGPRYGPGTSGGRLVLNQKTFEIYQPPYFFPLATTRCRIVRVTRGSSHRSTRRAEYGETIRVTTSSLSGAVAVGLMRPGAATHHTDSEQRYIDLTATQAGDTLTVTMPTDARLAPRGWYMLWVIAGGRPCVEAYWIRLVPS